jgi:hypothetical protein
MQYQSIQQPFINFKALLRSLAMWFIVWGGLVAIVTYAGQPGVACMTPLAWLLALPAGWNYVVFSGERAGKQPFIGGAILGAILGLLFGVLFYFVANYGMPVGDDPEEIAKMNNIVIFMIAGGTVIAAILSGFMAYRASSLQRRGQALPTISVR